MLATRIAWTLPAILPIMNDVPTIRLAAASHSVQIALQGRPYPASADPWDRDAIHATVLVHAGTFRGALSTTVWSHELRALGRLLADLYEHVGCPRRERCDLLKATCISLSMLRRMGGSTSASTSSRQWNRSTGSPRYATD